MSLPRPASHEAQTQIGPYTILQEVGRGGQGVVYLARDLFGLEVAIKSIPTDDRPDAMEHLRREGEFLALLNHPNIARVYAPLLEGGRLYMVMEYVRGHSLAERLQHGALARGEALNICRQVALAADAAHHARIVHRDLKPSNIRITPDGTVKVVDFGVAESTGGDVPPGPRSPGAAGSLSRTSRLAGTYAYMAPEQMMGGPVDQRADIWAFGCVAYECLTGSPLFSGRSFEDYFMAIAARTADLAGLPPDTPRRVRSILKQCLVRNPGDRLASIAEVIPVFDGALRRRVAAAPEHAPKSNIPSDATSFVGRGADLAALAALVRESRCVCITGPGGSGKTRVALELGRRLARDFRDGVWAVDLADLDEARPLEAVVASVLPASLQAGATGGAIVGAVAAPDRLVCSLAGADVLLILDECDRLQRPVAELCGVLLQRCPRVRILATSRGRLEIAGHQRFQLEPLEVPPERFAHLPPHELARFDSVALFIDRARLVDRLFSPGAAEMAAVAEVCRKVEGIPLAVEIAAARVDSLRPGELLRRLDSVLSDPAQNTWDRRPHHWTIDACIRWSHDLLPTAERHILTRVSVFTGGWTLEAAEAVCAEGAPGIAAGDIHVLLTQLVNKSLVSYNTGTGRYSVLESIRRFARAKLNAPEVDRLRGRHFAYFVGLAKRTETQILGNEQVTGMRAVQADIENFRSAMQYDGVEPSRILELVTNLGRFFYLKGLFSEGRSLVQRAMQAAADASARLRARGSNVVGILAFGQQDFGVAEAAYRETLETFERLGDRAATARVLGNLANVLAYAGRHDESEHAYLRALDIDRELGDHDALMRVQLNYAYLKLLKREYDTASALLDECLAAFRRVGEQKREATALHTLGEVAYFRGELDAATERFAQSLRIKDELGDRRGISLSLYMHGLVLVKRGAYAPAATLVSKAWSLRAELGIIGSPVSPAEHDSAMNAMRAALGQTRFDEAWAQGQALYDEDAVHSITRVPTRKR